MKQETNKSVNFKQWVEQHDPQCKWNWDNPSKLSSQLCSVIGESGHIQLKDIFIMMFASDESGLSFDQNEKFIKENY